MITITGLGPGNIGCLTLDTWDIIKNASKVFLQTMRHPCAEDLRARGISVESFDKYYEEMGSFEEVCGAIAAAVLCAAADGSEVVFAVPGSPLVAEKPVELIIAGAREKNIPLKIIPAERVSLDQLVNIMAMLRSPDGGCAWDLEQTSKSIAGYLVEEVYEVLEAIDLGDSELLAEELGDLLLHIVFQARMAEEQGLFSMKDVVAGVSAKMIRRHPHVFGNTKVKSAADVVVNWDKIKKQEKNGRQKSFLDGIPKGAPSLLSAFKLQVKAAKAGFDWDNEAPVWEKVYEELAELKEAVEEFRINGAGWDKTKSNAENLDKVKSELGDAFFALVNLARFLNTDPETALHAANNKFTRRFHYMEKAASAQGQSLLDFDQQGLDNLWEEAKKKLPESS